MLWCEYFFYILIWNRLVVVFICGLYLMQNKIYYKKHLFIIILKISVRALYIDIMNVVFLCKRKIS